MTVTDIVGTANGPTRHSRFPMRVFVTGGSGWIGSALVPDLISHGHEVLALARSEASADALASAGAQTIRGSLEDLDVLAESAATTDGTVHLAFIHDFTQYDAANASDRAAIEAMAAALAGTDRPLVIASGVATTARNRPATEEDAAAPEFPRSAAATMTLAWADKGVRTSAVQLPPTVHGQGDKGFIAMMIAIAREKGVSGYIGDGSNVWPATHRADAAPVFRLALEQASPGSVWHAVAEQGVPTRAIAERIGEQLALPVASIEPSDASGHFGWIAFVWGADLPTSSELTRERLQWHPAGPTLLEDIEAGHYFH
jgi:nucleoside-diphosphate-sugar epimerase